MTDSDHYAQLPPEWAWKTLGEVCGKPQYGYTTKAATEGSLKFLRTTDITQGPIDWQAVPYCAQEPEETQKYLLQDGDIVISRSGSIGASALVKDPPSGVFASYLIRFRPEEELIDPAFLSWYLKSPRYWREVKERASGIGMSNINAKKLSSIPVPLPPRNNQAAIVARIEDLERVVKEGKQSLDQVRRNCDRVERGLLQRLFSQGSCATVGELIERIEAGRSFRCEERPASQDEWGVVKVSAMTWGSFRESENKTVLDLDQVDPRWEIRPGDVLVSRANTSAYVGASVLVRSCRPKLLLSDKSLRLVPRDGIDPAWLQLALSAPGSRLQMTEVATGTSDSMRNLSQAKLRAVALRVPTPEKQQLIVREARETLGILRSMRLTVDESLRKAASLMNSVLSKAFVGSLSNPSRYSN